MKDPLDSRASRRPRAFRQRITARRASCPAGRLPRRTSAAVVRRQHAERRLAAAIGRMHRFLRALASDLRRIFAAGFPEKKR